MVRATVLFFSLLAVSSAKKCQELTVPISITGTNYKLDVKAPSTNSEATVFIQNVVQQGRNFAQEVNKGANEISGNYSLAATYCAPDNGKTNGLQILTHGIAFDRRYWDLPYNNYNYSYVEKAVNDHGYSTLTWDRLGIGASSKGDPVNEIQAGLEMAALRELTNKAKSGEIPGLPDKLDKIFHVGHSFGSSLSYGIAGADSQITDGLVLTGFSHVTNFVPLFAVSNGFVPVNASSIPDAKEYPEGYLASASPTGAQMNFFAEDDFDSGLLKEFSLTYSQPASVGELLTVTTPALKKSEYAGPVLVITGEKDLPFCGGDCNATEGFGDGIDSLLDITGQYMPLASLHTEMIPGAGHGLNMAYSHVLTYTKILEFLEKN